MKLIPLYTKRKQIKCFVIIDESDYDYLIRFKWSFSRGCSTNYAKNSVLGPMHRYLLQPEKGFVVDHINGNGLDNRRENLEIVTVSENIKRAKKTQTYKNNYYKMLQEKP